MNPWIHNALFFGAALVALLVGSFILSRVTTRVLGLAVRVAGEEEREVLRKVLAKRASRVILLLTGVLGFALVAAAVILSLYSIDVVPPVLAWFDASLLREPAVLSWLFGQLILIALAAVVVHRVLRVVVDLVIGRLQANPAFLRHHEQLARLRGRAFTALRWGTRLGALLAAALLLELPVAVVEPIAAATYIVAGVLLARALVTVADIGVDIVVQLVRTLEGRRPARRDLGRLEYLASITKRTLEYVCFVGAGTFVVHHLRPDTWLTQIGVVALRLIALIYIGRVIIEVIGLVLREALLADQDRRKEAERQQRMTLVPVATSILRYAVYFCMAVMSLQELGVDTSPILAGAGLLGLAVGLGAQAFVGDVVSGFFILFEGLFLVGDRIRVGDVVGSVEEIGVRVLKIRDEYGVLHCIPNGEVRQVANHARQYVNAVVEFHLPYGEDIAGILDHLSERLSARRSAYPDMLSDPEFSIQEFKDSGALIRTLVKVKPSCDDAVAEIVRAELFAAMSDLDVTPNVRHVVTLHRSTRGHPRPEPSWPEMATGT